MSIKPTTALTRLSKPRIALGLGLLLTVVLAIFTQFTTMDLIGWSSGFTHPLHGSDHLLAMLAVGIWAAQLRGSAIWLLPLTFVGVMSLGGLVGATGILLPGAEAIIFCSCIAFIGLIFKRIRFSHPINVGIVAFFAFFHGFAHGQEISTSASLISYTLGFMVATLLLHGTGIIIVRLLIAVFALFLSHAVYPEPLQNNDAVLSIKTSATVSTIYTLENSTHLNANPDSASVQDITQAVNPPPIIATDHPSNLNKAFNTVLFITESALFKFSAFNYQTGIDFLTNGVGLTSPPLWLTLSKLCYFDSPVINYFSLSFLSDRLLSSLYHYTRLQNLYLLATSFLTNGVGATSPPTSDLVVIVVFLCCIVTAFYFSSVLKNLRLPLAIKQLVFSNSQLQPCFLLTDGQLAYHTTELAIKNNNKYWTFKGLSS
ncbi:MAG: HupE/UreJ family protein [Methylococcales bacterium]|nr:HupE/UreJ family protein [Methylococcales bacterium]